MNSSNVDHDDLTQAMLKDVWEHHWKRHKVLGEEDAREYLHELLAMTLDDIGIRARYFPKQT